MDDTRPALPGNSDVPWYEMPHGMDRELAKYDQCEEPGDCDHDHDAAFEYLREQELDGLRKELAAVNARAVAAEARLASRAELDAATKPLEDHVRKLRDIGDQQVATFTDGLIAENCDLRAEVERLNARIAALGIPEIQHRLIYADGTPHAPTDFDLAHPDWWMPGVRHEVRDVYPTSWRPAPTDSEDGG